MLAKMKLRRKGDMKPGPASSGDTVEVSGNSQSGSESSSTGGTEKVGDGGAAVVGDEGAGHDVSAGIERKRNLSGIEESVGGEMEDGIEARDGVLDARSDGGGATQICGGSAEERDFSTEKEHEKSGSDEEIDNEEGDLEEAEDEDDEESEGESEEEDVEEDEELNDENEESENEDEVEGGDDDDDDDDDEGADDGDEAEDDDEGGLVEKTAKVSRSQRPSSRNLTAEKRTPKETTKSANIAALLSGDLVVKRQALLPKVLHVAEGAAVARGAFKSPIPSHATATSELQRRLLVRKRFIPWQSRTPFVPITNLPPRIDPPIEDLEVIKAEELPPGVEPLVLWQAETAEDDALEAPSIFVDPILVKFLRPHQREGVQFMFECVAALRDYSKSEEDDPACCGCILADDMGLGKTLQSITLLWTLLRQGFTEAPLAKRVLIVTPTSLVSNWESELNKWLLGRVSVIAVGESTRAEVISGISNFVSPRNPYQVMIISYETFRLHAAKFQNEGSCDLLICDEAHRLKNDQTLTNQALASLHCRRRVLLSGTPMQNDLEEFFAMVNFANPGILGNAAAFRRYYENPILTGREPDATDEARDLSAERSSELSEIVNQFILRRTNTLLSNHLPPKIVQVVCCKLTDLQLKLYEHFIHSKNVRQVLEDQTKRAKVLASITALKKLCNHPKLIYDSLRAGGSQAAGFEDCMQYFPQGMFSSSSRMGTAAFPDGSWIELSGKMAVLARLLANIREKTDDRIVLVSNYTQTLDLFSQICRERRYPYVRLDGTTSLSKRQKLVQRFNDPAQNEFAFLLSSKAGGCGLNLIGGNRLVLFDPDWNPATDKQAAARVWRDGQKKRVFLYRFLASGTIEEKVYQRQISKEGLQKVVDKEQNDRKFQANDISTEDLRDLFTLRENAGSDTHETLGCKRCDPDSGSDNGEEEKHVPDSTTSDDCVDIGRFAEVAGCLDKLRPWEKQVGSPAEEDLKNWAHHAHSSTIPDALLQVAACDEITFAFTCQVDGKLAPVETSQKARPLENAGSRLRVNREPLPIASVRGNTSVLPVKSSAESLPNRTAEPKKVEASSHIPERKVNGFVAPTRAPTSVVVPKSRRTSIKRNASSALTNTKKKASRKSSDSESEWSDVDSGDDEEEDDDDFA